MAVNNDEVLLEVDETDLPIGELSRREMKNGTNKWVRTGDVMVVNDKHQILCHQRNHQLHSWPGLWAHCFGGHAEPGETPIETALKELREESSIVASASDLISLGVYRDQSRRKFKHYFLLRWNDDIDGLDLEDEEVEQAKWIELDEVRKIHLNQDQKWARVGVEVFQLEQVKSLLELTED